METTRAIVSAALALSTCIILAAGCETTYSLDGVLAYETKKGECIDFIEQRLSAALTDLEMPADLNAAAIDVVAKLPHQERDALKRAGEFFVAEHGQDALPRGSELERSAYWSALYHGFADADLCSESRRDLSEFVIGGIFISKLDSLMLSRGVDTGSPSIAHTDLLVAIVRVAAGLPSNNSSKGMPLRGTP